MTTVGDVVERLYLQYLQPPDSEPAMVGLQHQIDADVTAFEVGNFHVPEDEALLRIGSVLEIERELMRVVDWDEPSRRIQVTRHVRGTTPAAHPLSAHVTLSPPFPRSVVFDTMGDNIVALGARLYTVSGDLTVELFDGRAPIEDPLAYQVESFWVPGKGELEARIVDVDPELGTRAVVTYTSFGTAWVRYRRRMQRPASEATTLEDVGMEPSWVTLILVSTAADLLIGRDIPALHSEWITQSLEVDAENPGARSSVALQLARYREVLLERFAHEMEIEYGIETEMLSPFRKSVRPGLG